MRTTPRPFDSQLTCAATTMAIAAQTAAITMKVTPKSYRRMHVAPGEVRKHESSVHEALWCRYSRSGAAWAMPRIRLGEAATSVPANIQLT